MDIKIVENIESKESTCKTEAFKDDLATDQVYSIVDAVPIAGQKLIKIQLEGGDSVIIAGEIVDTSDLTPGEKRIRSTDADGVEKSSTIYHDDGIVETKNDKISMTIDANGKIEIKNIASDDLIALIHDLSTNLQTAVTDLIGATTATALGSQPLSIALTWPIPVVGLLAKVTENATKINLYKR